MIFVGNIWFVRCKYGEGMQVYEYEIIIFQNFCISLNGKLLIKWLLK